jgi:hypothetical protein
MADLFCKFIAVFLVTSFVPVGVQGQSRESTYVPDRFEFFEGHAYIGGEWVKWEHDRLVFVKRVAETTEQLSPTPEGWQRFWARIDSLGVWQWKPDYNEPKRDWPDGESWALTLRTGAKQLKSKGYNAVPNGYGEFREAVHKLMEDARQQKRD